jgi:hypothetical protein
MADSKEVWTALEHMEDTTNDLAALTQKTTHGKTLLLNRMRDKWISQTDFK